jgi:glutamate racemase
VELVERGVTSGPELDEFLAGLFTPLRGLDVQVVVLGCTHFVFVRLAIENCFAPRPLVVDGNQGTAANLVRELTRRDLLRQTGEDRHGAVEFITTGERERCEPIFQRLMAVPY